MWLVDVLVLAVVLAGIYGFVTLIRQRTRWMSSHTYRRAEDLYPGYADGRKRRRWFRRA